MKPAAAAPPAASAGPKMMNPPGGMMPPPPPSAVPYGKLFHWGWFVVRGAFGLFLVNTLLTLVVQTLLQYNVQVLSVVVTALQSGGEAHVGPAQGFMERLVPSSARVAALLFTGISVAGILLTLLDRVLTQTTDNTMLSRLQQRLHDRLLELGPAYHAAHDMGQTNLIVTRFSAGTQLMLRELISFPLVRGVGLVTAVVLLAGNLGQIGDTPAWMQITLFGSVLILPIGGWWMSKQLRGAFGKVRDSELALADELTNSIQLPLEVQLMGAQQQRSDAFASKLRVHVKNKVRASLRNEVSQQFQQVTPVLLRALFLVYGIFFALASGNPRAAGPIVAILGLVPEVVSPVQQILQFILGLSSAWPQVEKVVEILDGEAEINERSDARELPPGNHSLVADHVVFAYAVGGSKQLDDLSYTFEPGKVTAIVARAGMGKSTLLNLAARVRDPQSGALRLGGDDLRELKLSNLRRHVAKVSQFPLFLAGSIRDNFKLARADATDADIEAVCRKTALWDVLVKVSPTGPLDYPLPRAVGEGLSGGQRRLLAVTRALLLHPTVLLLDEPTTGIDSIGRQMLVPVIKNACQGMTVLLVDHDMEFVSRVADRVCILEDGKFTQEGPPAELATQDGLFRRLLESAREQKPEAHS